MSTYDTPNYSPSTNGSDGSAERPGRGFKFCVISPVARFQGVYYKYPRKWWKTSKEASAQAKEIIRHDPTAVLVVVKATHQIESDPHVRTINLR